MTEEQQELAPDFEHPFPPVLQGTETCLPSISQSCRSLPGLQGFALVVATASKAEFAPRPHEAAFIILFSSQSSWPLLKQGPTHPAYPQEESPWISFYRSTLLSCFYNFLLCGMILFIYLLARWLLTLLFSSFSPFPRTMSSRQYRFHVCVC